jgi:hypothetical protein
MALNSNALLDFATVQGILDRDASEQSFFEYLINVASDMCEKYTGRQLAAQDSTIFLNNLSTNNITTANLFSVTGYVTNVIIAPEYPVNGVLHLYLDATSKFGAGTECTTFTLDNDAGQIVINGATVPSGFNTVKLVYNTGYMPLITPAPTFTNAVSIAPLPATLQEAVIETVAWLAQRLKGRSIGERYTNKDGLNTTFEIQLPANVQFLLNYHKSVL